LKKCGTTKTKGLKLTKSSSNLSFKELLNKFYSVKIGRKDVFQKEESQNTSSKMFDLLEMCLTNFFIHFYVIQSMSA